MAALKLYRFTRFHSAALFEANGFTIPPNRDLQARCFALATSRQALLDRLGYRPNQVLDLVAPPPGFRGDEAVRALLEAHPGAIAWNPLTSFEDRLALILADGSSPVSDHV